MIACIDGCLIDIKKPTENANEYICQYRTPAINMMVIGIFAYIVITPHKDIMVFIS